MRYESNIEDRYLSYLDPGYRRLSDIRDVLGDMEGWLYLPEDDYKELIVILAETEDPNRLLDGINKLFAEFEKDTLDFIESFKPED